MKFFRSLSENKKKKPFEMPETDREGRAVITMTVRDDSDFLSPYSVSRAEVISSDVAEFIGHRAGAVPPEVPLTLHIYSDCIDDGEKDVYRAAIHQYFSLQAVSEVHESRRNRVLAVLMTLVGIFGLAFMFVADRLGAGALWIECIDIFAWVFLWEAVDLFFICGGRLRLRRRRLFALSHMPVEFYPLAEKP